MHPLLQTADIRVKCASRAGQTSSPLGPSCESTDCGARHHATLTRQFTGLWTTGSKGQSIDAQCTHTEILDDAAATSASVNFSLEEHIFWHSHSRGSGEGWKNTHTTEDLMHDTAEAHL